ncbi:MAG: aromatic amino acid lyase, partial [Pseudomonadota bacterium]
MSVATLRAGEASVELAALRRAYYDGVRVSLDAAAWHRVEASCAAVRELVDRDGAVYGINTGFGVLAQTRIDDAQLGELQHNLVLSHAAGVGALLDARTVGRINVLKVVCDAEGPSGVR